MRIKTIDKSKYPPKGSYKWNFVLFGRECRICRDTIYLEWMRFYWSDTFYEYFRPVCKKCGENPEIGAYK